LQNAGFNGCLLIFYTAEAYVHIFAQHMAAFLVSITTAVTLKKD